MSQRNSGFDRIANDLYETPIWVTRGLLENVLFSPRVWEPACGNGKLVGVLKQFGYSVNASDVVQRACPDQTHVEDFLKTEIMPWGERSAIVTNPPFGARGLQAVAFIKHALALTKRCNGQVAMLLPTDFDHAKTRADIFDKCPAFAGRVVLVDRIRWIESSTGSPSQNFAWFHWNWLNQHAPTISYAGKN